MLYNKAASESDIHGSILNPIQASNGKFRMIFIIQGGTSSD